MTSTSSVTRAVAELVEASGPVGNASPGKDQRMTALFMAEMELDNAEQTRLIVLEATIDRGQKVFVEVGLALAEIRDSRLYRENHKTFEDYCRDRWQLSRPRAYQLIDAAATTKTLSTTVDILPANERQARPLTDLEPEQQREVWNKSVETSPTGQPTAAHVEQTKRAIYGRPLTAEEQAYRDGAAERRNHSAPPPDEDDQLLDDLPADPGAYDETEGEEKQLSQTLETLYKKCGALFERWKLTKTADDASDVREELYDTMCEYEGVYFSAE